MKKQILPLLAIAILLLSACKKDDVDQTTKETGTYQPFTAGSTWNYREESFDIQDISTATVDTSVNTMTAVTKIFGGKTFTQLTAVIGLETENEYFSFSNHVYYYRIPFDGTEANLELPYLNEDTAVNGTWTMPVTIEDAVEPQVKGNIIEKGINKVILGTSYSNVIHSKLELQTKSGGAFTTIFTFDFYVAKNIGIIGIYIATEGKQITKSELISYKIK